MTYAVHNPKDKPLEDLPVIYGFNNGGNKDFLSGVLIAEDGTILGGHACSNEGFMRGDLGILEGSRPDRHEAFKEHYPDGYRMDFVPYKDADSHIGLSAAFEKHKAASDQPPISTRYGGRCVTLKGIWICFGASRKIKTSASPI